MNYFSIRGRCVLPLTIAPILCILSAATLQAAPHLELLSPRGSLIPTANFASRPVISSDGLQIVFAAETPATLTTMSDTRQLYIFNRVSNQVVRLSSSTGTNQGHGNNPTLSSNGRHAAFASTAFASPTTLRIFAVDRDADNNNIFDESGVGRRFTTISTSSDGTSFGNCDQPSMSASGRYIAFISASSGLVPGGVNTGYDLYVKDRDLDNNGVFDETPVGAHKTVRVSVSSSGVPANNPSNVAHPAISADGRFVVFESTATNLVADDSNGFTDIFLHDRDADGNGVFDEPGHIATTRVSVSSGGAQADAPSYDPSISADGRYIAFTSTAGNLVSGLDRRTFAQIYIHDRTTHTTQLISRSTNGEPASTSCLAPRWSADGNHLVFVSPAGNLLQGGSNGAHAMFRWDRGAPDNGLTRLNPAYAGQPEFSCIDPTVSADGRLVAFATLSTNLAVDGARTGKDVFGFDPAPCSPEVSIVQQPADVSACDNGNVPVTFSVAAVGEPPLRYQWFRNNVAIAGATSDHYTINFTSAGTAGTYTVSVANPCKVITSQAATLTLRAQPTVSSNPANQQVCLNAPVTFSAFASGQSLTYQWYFFQAPIPGATSRIYSIPAVTQADQGSYFVRVTNDCGITNSATATLTVRSLLSAECVRWFPKAPALAPAARSRHAMVFDAARRQSVMYGGITAAPDDAIWLWDGQSWQSRSPAVRPPQRSEFGMTYDSVRSVVLIFGGRAPGGALLNDLWSWNGAEWLQLSPPGIFPDPRAALALAYDRVRDRTVLFGGQNAAAQAMADTWEWNGATWELKLTQNIPPARWDHAMAFDGARGAIVLHGGSDDSVDTWEYDGLNWYRRTQSPIGPHRRHAMVFVDSHPATYLYANSFIMDTRVYAWSVVSWLNVQPAAPAPAARSATAMSYDIDRQRIVIFGGAAMPSGTALNDTWEFGRP